MRIQNLKKEEEMKRVGSKLGILKELQEKEEKEDGKERGRGGGEVAKYL